MSTEYKLFRKQQAGNHNCILLLYRLYRVKPHSSNENKHFNVLFCLPFSSDDFVSRSNSDQQMYVLIFRKYIPKMENCYKNADGLNILEKIVSNLIESIHNHSTSNANFFSRYDDFGHSHTSATSER